MSNDKRNINWDELNDDLLSCIKLRNYTSIDQEAENQKESIRNKVFSKIDTKNKVQMDIKTGSKGKMYNIAKWYMFAASILLFFSVSSILYFISSYKAIHINDIAYVEVVSPYSAITKVYLPDSTEVILNSNSKLKYPILFTENNKEVELRGEAFFNVRKQIGKPLIIKSNLLKTYVLGTQFNIKSTDQDKYIQLTLLEGSIIGEIQKGNNNTHRINLLPNQQLVIDKESVEFSRRQVEAKDYTLWTNGDLALRYANLEQIKTALENRFNLKISIDKNAVNQNDKYLATFDKTLTIDEILEILSYKRNWYYIKTDNGYHIYLK